MCEVSLKPYCPSISAAALMVVALVLASAPMLSAEGTAQARETIDVQGNRRVGVKTVRS